jgi:hypothetical protein
MVLLRSLPEFSTMCISAIDFLGDAMYCKGSAIDYLGDALNCKGSVFGTIDCNDSSWCDSRDEVIESKSASDIVYEEDLSTRYGDLLDTQSLSSSIHNLLHDSPQRLGQHAMPTRKISDDDIFRVRKLPQESSRQSLPFNKLNRCTAWIQDDYSFESEQLRDESKMESVRIVHWEDRVHDSDSLNARNGCGIFRPNDVNAEAGNEFLGSCKLHRCSAWSLDDSSLIIDDNVSSVRRASLFRSNQADTVHWDEIVQGTIKLRI